MRLANTVSDSIVDGPGLRLTVFTQGCLHACLDCHNPETHALDGGQERALQELYPLLTKSKLTEGLTLSGGEPFLQAQDCALLAKAAHEQGLNVWTYTGYRYEKLLAEGNPDWDALLLQTDVLVDGLYIAAEKDYTLRFRGSRNQRLIDLPKSRAAGRVILWEEDGDALSHFSVPES